jgi:rsbT co-antagonist protein RsbR
MSDNRRLTTRELLELYGLDSQDLQRVVEYGRIVLPRIDKYVEEFYRWMATQPEFELFFSDKDRLAHVQKLQVDYWREFFGGQVDDNYVSKRREVGETHARIGLSLPAYFAAMNVSLRLLTETLYSDDLGHDQYAASVKAITKLLHMDTAIVVDTFAARTNRIIADQHEALLEMSTPVTEIWADILMLPIVGFVDSKRAQDIMNAVLTKIAESHSRFMILDISGVAIMDTAVANHLIKITKATRLMGCVCTISGVSPAIAETVVSLGIDIGNIRTTATLKDALHLAFAETGVRLESTK